MTKILLVEDNELNQDMLSRRLMRRGFEVVFATDGATGVSMASSEKPDLILMDMSLPVMDGWEATQSIKSNPHTASIPIIALTAHAMVGDRDKAMAAGCDDYDTKPVELARLLQKIDALLATATQNKAIVSPPQANPAPLPTAPLPVYIPQSSETTEHRILIVDDNEMNRDMLSRRLNRAGYAVLMAEDGEAGLSLIMEQSVDLILLDIMMPGISGLDVLQQIRQSYSQVQLPIIMATAKDESDDIVKAFELGANDYVTKPIDLPVLLARIKMHLRTLQSSHPLQPASPVSVEKSQPTKSIASEVLIPEVLIPEITRVETLASPHLSRYKMHQTLTQNQSRHCYLAKDTQTPDGLTHVVEHFQFNPKQTSFGNIAHHIFQAEVDTFKTLNASTSVAQVVDTSWQNGEFYLVREFVEGTPLSEEVNPLQRLMLRNVITLAINLLETVRVLHEQSIVHQTLQPGSFIRRSSDRQLVLANNGLSSRIEIALWKQSDRQNDLPLGLSTSYVAPEQLQGVTLFSSDIYAIGMITSEALSRIEQIVMGKGSFDDILNKMICKNPAKRYTSIQEVLDDLQQLPMVAMFQQNKRSLMQS
jgi:DNA-binding response OmpR family regulator